VTTRPQRGRPRRTYSDDEREVALATLRAARGNLQVASRATGVPVVILERWRDEAGPATAKRVRKTCRSMEAHLHKVILKLQRLTVQKLEKLSIDKAIKAWGNALDLSLALRGGPVPLDYDWGQLTPEELNQVRAITARAAERARSKVADQPPGPKLPTPPTMAQLLGRG
jgi:hypothetical protein